MVPSPTSPFWPTGFPVLPTLIWSLLSSQYHPPPHTLLTPPLPTLLCSPTSSLLHPPKCVLTTNPTAPLGMWHCRSLSFSQGCLLSWHYLYFPLLVPVFSGNLSSASFPLLSRIGSLWVPSVLFWSLYLERSRSHCLLFAHLSPLLTSEDAISDLIRKSSNVTLPKLICKFSNMPYRKEGTAVSLPGRQLN